MADNTLKITGWKADGLRCPETIVDLSHSESRIAFIQMPNGTGKTTTYNLIDFAFDKRPPEQIDVLQYDLTKDPITLSKWISGMPRRFNPPEQGTFELYCEFNSKALIIHLEFDFILNKVIKSYTHGGQSKIKFSALKAKVKRMIKSGITSFMMLDGERAQAFLNESQHDAEDAIASIHQMDVLTNVLRFADMYYSAAMEKTTKKGARRQEITTATNKQRKAEESWNKLKQDKSEIGAKIAAKNQELTDSIEEKDALGAGNTARQSEIQDLKDKIAEFRVSWHNEQNKQIPMMCDNVLAFSSGFGQELLQLRDNLEKNKLPESAGKEWFIELSEQEKCVCGRPIEATDRLHIQNHSAQYLSTNHQNILNLIKSKIREDIEPHSGDFEKMNKELHNLVSESSRNYQSMVAKQQDYDNLTEEIAKESGRQDDLNNLVLKISQLESGIEDLEREKADLNAGAGNPKSVEYARVQFKSAKDNLKQYTEAYTLVTRMTRLDDMIRTIYERVRSEISQKVTDETNETCRRILGNDDMDIESIGKSLVLKGSNDRETGGSVGQTMVLAYSFIQVLNKQTGIQIPLILDSPVGPADTENRKEIADILWNLGERNLIIFIINTEKNDFVDRIQDNAKSESKEHEVMYITQFKRNKKTERFFGEDTREGFISYESDFFDEFAITSISDGDE